MNLGDVLQKGKRERASVKKQRIAIPVTDEENVYLRAAEVLMDISLTDLTRRLVFGYFEEHRTQIEASVIATSAFRASIKDKRRRIA